MGASAGAVTAPPRSGPRRLSWAQSGVGLPRRAGWRQALGTQQGTPVLSSMQTEPHDRSGAPGPPPAPGARGLTSPPRRSAPGPNGGPPPAPTSPPRLTPQAGSRVQNAPAEPRAGGMRRPPWTAARLGGARMAALAACTLLALALGAAGDLTPDNCIISGSRRRTTVCSCCRPLDLWLLK